MSERDFMPIADSLRREVIDFYRERGEELVDAAGVNTVETNSGFVERRGRPLLEILYRSTDLDSIEGLRVLDLGCGFGALSTFFAAKGADVTAIDPQDERFAVGRAVAAEHGLPVEFSRGRMEALELAERSFDLAVMNNSLCYLIPRQERRAALAESGRVLRPGGSLVIRNPNRWNPLDQFTRIPLIQLLPPRPADRIARLFGRERSEVRLTSPIEARRELQAAGFGEVRHLSPEASGWHKLMKSFARYQHLIAHRPVN